MTALDGSGYEWENTLRDAPFGDKIVDGGYTALPDPVADRIFEVVMCLAGEVWAVRDRLRLAEAAIASEYGIDLSAAVDVYRERGESLDAMREDRDAFVERVLRPLRVRTGSSRTFNERAIEG